MNKERRREKMKKKLWIALIVIAVIGAAAAAAKNALKQPSREGYKELKIKVVDQDGKTILDQTYETDADNLTGFLENSARPSSYLS
jgi:flagellar basal body-associated protein FliL